MVSPGSAAATRRSNSLRCFRFKRPLSKRSKVDILRFAMAYSSNLNSDPGSARLAKKLQTLQRGRAGLFQGTARHQSMHRGSRSHAVKRAQGTKRSPTIACRPGPVTIKQGSDADSSFWFNTL